MGAREVAGRGNGEAAGKSCERVATVGTDKGETAAGAPAMVEAG